MNKSKDYIYLSLEEGEDIWANTKLIDKIKEHSPYYECRIYLVSKSEFLSADSGYKNKLLTPVCISTELDESFYARPTYYLQSTLDIFVEHVALNKVRPEVAAPIIDAVYDKSDTYYLACDMTATLKCVNKTHLMAYYVQALTEYPELSPDIFPRENLNLGE